MKRSEVFGLVAKRFPSLFRLIFTLSVHGYLPPIHNHWLFRDVGFDLFDSVGFPMRNGPFRLFIPRELRSIYIGYFDFLDHEPLTTKVFASLLKTGDVVVDVGANIGHYTLLAAAAVGTNGRVHAIECSQETLKVLTDNVQRNQLSNVEIHPVAASSTRGTLELNVTAIGLSWFNPHSQWPTVKGCGSTVCVPAVPLDDIISSPIQVVKIDAEGMDLDVLKGMNRLLTENQEASVIVEWAPPLLVEIGKDPMELPRWLQEAGFNRICALDEIHKKQRSLEEAVEMVRAGNLPRDWVCDLFAQRVPQSQ